MLKEMRPADADVAGNNFTGHETRESLR